MELKEAQDFFSKFTESILKLNAEIKYGESRTKELALVKLEVQKQKEEINRLRSIERTYNHIKHTRIADICPQCDGAGGFVYDMGEQGCEGEECQVCEGCGLVDRIDIPKPKTINEYWEEYRSTTNNDDAWSFKEWLRIKLEVEGKFTIVTFSPIGVPANKSEIDSSDPF